MSGQVRLKSKLVKGMLSNNRLEVVRYLSEGCTRGI